MRNMEKAEPRVERRMILVTAYRSVSAPRRILRAALARSVEREADSTVKFEEAWREAWLPIAMPELCCRWGPPVKEMG